MLRKSQKDEYKEVGAIVVEGVLDETARAQMKQVLADLVEGSRAVKAHDKVYDLEPGHSSEEPRVRRIKKPHLVNPVFAEFLRAPKLIGILRDLLGDSVRLHGSAQNTSDQSRGLLLYEAAAADAFPLMGIPDYEEFKGRLLCGKESIVPRMVDCPVRMPLPPALNQGSIYENQTASAKRFFEVSKVAK